MRNSLVLNSRVSACKRPTNGCRSVKMSAMLGKERRPELLEDFPDLYGDLTPGASQ